MKIKEIEVNKLGIIRLNKPLEFKYRRKEGLYIIEEESITLYVYGFNKKDLYHELKIQLGYIIIEYLCCEKDILTKKALIVRKTMSRLLIDSNFIINNL